MKKTIKKILLMSLICSMAMISCSKDSTTTAPPPPPPPPPPPVAFDKRETFIFSSNGTSIEGEIFVPAEHETNKNLPAIYLFDFPEATHMVATDEFEKVIEGVKAVQGLNALVITMDEYKNNDIVLPGEYQEYSDIFKNMAAYVDEHYTNNSSRTFIARGSDAGLVIMTLFLEEKETSLFQNFIATDSGWLGSVIQIMENETFPQEKENKKFHYSYTSDNVIGGNIEFIDAVRAKVYPWLDFETIEYQNLTFENSYQRAFTDGIKYVFED